MAGFGSAALRVGLLGYIKLAAAVSSRASSWRHSSPRLHH